MVSCTSIYLMLRNGELYPIKTRSSRRQRADSDHHSINSSSPTLKSSSLPTRRHTISEKVSGMFGLRKSSDSTLHSPVKLRKEGWDSDSTDDVCRKDFDIPNELTQLRERATPIPLSTPTPNPHSRIPRQPSSSSSNSSVRFSEPPSLGTAVSDDPELHTPEILQPSRYSQSFSSLAMAESNAPRTSSPEPAGEDEVEVAPHRPAPVIRSWSTESGLSIRTFEGGTKFIEGL
jgi:hypothetical protein